MIQQIKTLIILICFKNNCINAFFSIVLEAVPNVSVNNVLFAQNVIVEKFLLNILNNNGLISNSFSCCLFFG